MKNISKFAGVYIAYLMQNLLLNDISILGCSPDILFAVLAVYAVSCEFPTAMMLGGFAGLLTDSLQGSVFGVGILIYMYFALILSLLTDKKTENSPLIVSGISFVGISVMLITVAVLKNMLGVSVPIGYLLSKILIKGVSGALFALLIVWVIQCRKTVRKDASKSEKEATE